MLHFTCSPFIILNLKWTDYNRSFVQRKASLSQNYVSSWSTSDLSVDIKLTKLAPSEHSSNTWSLCVCICICVYVCICISDCICICEHSTMLNQHLSNTWLQPLWSSLQPSHVHGLGLGDSLQVSWSWSWSWWWSWYLPWSWSWW